MHIPYRQLPYRQRRLLRRAERALRRSDPHLAAMLVIFTRLYDREMLASPEQQARLRDRLGTAGPRSTAQTA